MGAGAVSRALLATLLVAACGPERRGDTVAEQRYGEWFQHARLVAEADSVLTIMRVRADSGSHDVLIVRYEFDTAPGLGDEVALTIGIDLGTVRSLELNRAHRLGPRGLLTAFSATCLCEPLRPDSVAGTLTLVTRGLRLLTGRIDATFYFTAWNDSSHHALHTLHQRLDGLRWK